MHMPTTNSLAPTNGHFEIPFLIFSCIFSLIAVAILMHQGP